MASGDDDLALTETVSAAPGAQAERSSAESGSTPAKLGKFRIESLLGAGGMGMVYEAFDLELERRVAVKVLHDTGSQEARARLLREARAMAKLSHPNVITVFEVGSVGERDYVAMELFPGGTLSDWLARDKPRHGEVLAALVAAGRGLAAAHAEGLVHRDFKPGNVLHGPRGRIVVTDFGLARGVGDGAPVPQGAAPSASASAAGAALETRTGALLGTPAYMAPEQWTGEAITPATDQFAFCVALWEALAGKRPYSGATLDELRAGVLRGPRELDDAAIPRALRPILRRGLALAPAQRWPSMDALLDAIVRTTRTRRRRVAAGGAGVLALGAIAVAFGASHRRSRRGAPSCDPPAIDARAVAREIAASPVAAPARALLDDWHRARTEACRAPRTVRTARLACLDGVLARLADALRSGATLDADGLAAELVDPAACKRAPPPHLVAPIEAPLAAAFAALRDASGVGPVSPDVATLVASKEPCVQVVALLAELARFEPSSSRARDFATAVGEVRQLRSVADRCNDDAIRVAALLTSADRTHPETIANAEAAVASLPTPAFRAALEEAEAPRAKDTKGIAAAIALLDRARAYHAAHGELRGELRDLLAIDRLRLERATPADLEAVATGAAGRRADARRTGVEAALVHDVAEARWRRGDVAGADALMHGVAYVSPTADYIDSQVHPMEVDGQVVDASGQPVAGAEVAATLAPIGDAAAVLSPTLASTTIARATTDAHGRFALHAARGFIGAAAGDRRSAVVPIAPHVTLQLAPTTHVDGDVALNGRPPGTVRVYARVDLGGGAGQIVVAPVVPGGHFELSHVLPGKLTVSAYGYDETAPPDAVVHELPPTGATGLHLEIHVAPPLIVIARSTTEGVPQHVVLFVFAGRHPLHGTMGDVFHQLGGPIRTLIPSIVDMAHVPAALRGKVEADDLTTELSPRPAGDLTICGADMPRKLLSNPQQMMADMMKFDAGCSVVGSDDTTVVVELPATRRIRN